MKNFTFFFTALLTAFCWNPLQGQSFTIQTYPGQSPISLNTPVKKVPFTGVAHTWWASASPVDPVTESARLLGMPDTESDSPGENWRSVIVPLNLIGQESFGPELKEAWYLKSIVLTEKPSEHLAVWLGEIMDRDAAYLNGVEIGRTGAWNAATSQGYDRQRLYSVPDHLWRKGRNVILVHARAYFPAELGIYRSQTAIGKDSDLRKDFYLRDLISVLFLVMYLTAGLYFLFLFIRRRAERENLFFTLFTLTLVIYQFLRTQLKYLSGLEFQTLKHIEYIALYLLVPLFYYFIRYLFRLPDTRFVMWLDRLILVPLLGVAALLAQTFIVRDPVVWNESNLLYMQSMIWPVYILTCLGILIYRLRHKDRDALMVISGLLVIMAGMIVDVLSNRDILNIPRVMQYAFVFFILSLALILANRFVRLHYEVEDLNRNLERKVDERTEQLQHSLEEVNALKVQQDGDYFLTSLLITPLGGNFVDSSTVTVEILVRQKKTFQFKKWNAEIGGDLCVAQSLTLRDRKYTVFLNGDAMGKSIQGAGGALVLGTVFKAMLARTEISSIDRKRYPEQWLKECFIELQNVFVSFDGHMMVSAIIGLVDDAAGTLYYLNAEHPSLVYFRAGKASFVPSDRILMKFGIFGLDNRLIINVFQMAPGDVVISGSDGRDDIMIGTDEKGNRIINEDENNFLRAVELSDGLLDRIEMNLRKTGELTDDLSLVRIAFREDAPAPELIIPAGYRALVESGRMLMESNDPVGALSDLEKAFSLYREDAELIRLLSQLYLKKKDYKNAARYCELYTELAPDNTSFLYAASFAMKQMAGRDVEILNHAAEFGERCRLRDMEHIKNMTNLADIYRLLGNKSRSQMLVDQALSIEQDNSQALKLRHLLA